MKFFLISPSRKTIPCVFPCTLEFIPSFHRKKIWKRMRVLVMGKILKLETWCCFEVWKFVNVGRCGSWCTRGRIKSWNPMFVELTKRIFEVLLVESQERGNPKTKWRVLRLLVQIDKWLWFWWHRSVDLFKLLRRGRYWDRCSYSPNQNLDRTGRCFDRTWIILVLSGEGGRVTFSICIFAN